MRTTWIILSIMVLAGVVMYWLSQRKSPPGLYDSISISDTSGRAVERVKVYLARNPVEVDYNDSTGWSEDSIPLMKILDGSSLNFFNKNYKSAALYFTLDNKYFFDFEIHKKDTSQAYDISFRFQPVRDSFYIKGVIDTHQDSVLRFSGPMIRMYKAFAVIYNYKLPPEPVDSNDLPEGPQPTKTISILSD